MAGRSAAAALAAAKKVAQRSMFQRDTKPELDARWHFWQCVYAAVPASLALAGLLVVSKSMEEKLAARNAAATDGGAPAGSPAAQRQRQRGGAADAAAAAAAAANVPMPIRAAVESLEARMEALERLLQEGAAASDGGTAPSGDVAAPTTSTSGGPARPGSPESSGGAAPTSGSRIRRRHDK